MRTADELDNSLERLLPYTQLSGIDKAAELVAVAVRRGAAILVVGDYDADGATACALGMRALQAMGGRVDFLVPDRMVHGYGLSPEVARLAAERKPALLITVDNGISSLSGVAEARSLGMQVVITDHHLPGALLPAADAIVNPNVAGDPFPSKALAGVGVMFYLLAAVRAVLRDAGWFAGDRTAPNLAQWLDIVALGTVADMVALDRNNRIFVAQGLERVRAGRGNPGIAALLEIGNRQVRNATASDFGFAVGPRLNAAGRLTDMRLGIECLLADDPATAYAAAQRLDRLNRERREIQKEMQRQALETLDADRWSADTGSAGLCLYDAGWHAGVVGILASQIKERVQRPVFAFAREADGRLRGSGRSVAGVHLRDALANVAAASPDLIEKYGGHAMAAGLTLNAGRLDEFRERFAAEIAARWRPDDASVLYSDGELAAEQLSLTTAELLRGAGPWGQEFPEPLFDGLFEVAAARVVGERHLKLGLRPAGSDNALSGIAFNHGLQAVGTGTRWRMAYRLDVNEYQGRRSAQLIVEHMEPV